MLKEDQKKQIASILPSRPADSELSSYLTDRTKIPGEAELICFPRSAQEISDLIRFARPRAIPIVPSGGRTGYAGGAAPRGGIVLSLERMNRIEKGPALLRLEAGVITADAQAAAREMGMMFPVDFASAGSSQIGGNLATNAGGIHVIRYGMIRQRVLSLEVVTGTGEILGLGSTVLKDNTGPDLKQLFIGSEGILGVITRADIRLARQPVETTAGIATAPDLETVLAILEEAEAAVDLLAFECMDRRSVEEVREHLGLPEPTPPAAYYVVMEYEGSAEFSFDLFAATSAEKRAAVWKYREGISESLSRHGPVKNDISIPRQHMADYVKTMRQAADRLGVDLVVFGHAGDGNLHMNLLNRSHSQQDFDRSARAFTEASYDMIQACGGSISAEHGIGLLKRDDFLRYGDPKRIALLRSIKSVLDPAGILNPGKVI